MKPPNKVVSGSDASTLACVCFENTTCFTPPLIEIVGCLWAYRVLGEFIHKEGLMRCMRCIEDHRDS